MYPIIGCLLACLAPILWSHLIYRRVHIYWLIYPATSQIINPLKEFHNNLCLSPTGILDSDKWNVCFFLDICNVRQYKNARCLTLWTSKRCNVSETSCVLLKEKTKRSSADTFFAKNMSETCLVFLLPAKQKICLLHIYNVQKTSKRYRLCSHFQ